MMVAGFGPAGYELALRAADLLRRGSD